MKKIDAIIRSSKFEEVKQALSEVGTDFFTFSEVKGYGRQANERVIYRGEVYDIGYIARLKLEIYTTNDKVEQIISAICQSAQTGEVGDGKVIVTNIEQIRRIRTNEDGEDAL